MRVNVDLKTAASHPLVLETLEQARRELQFSEQPKHVYQGGHGVIFLCRIANGQLAVLKIPSYTRRLPDQEETLREFIRREARILSSVNCAALPKLIFAHPEGRFLVREYIPGLRLSDFMSKSRQSDLNELMFTLLKTAAIVFKAFHECEAGGYVVRDWKGNNLIVSETNRRLLKLIDLDSTRTEGEAITNNPTAMRLGSGKWLHWPPEQLLQLRSRADPRMDYFALGVTGFTMIAGVNPFSNCTRTPERVLDVYLDEYNAAKALLRKRNSSVNMGEEIVEFLIECLHPSAQHRPGLFRLERLLANWESSADFPIGRKSQGESGSADSARLPEVD
jgi:serine/threonine protein kinase